MQRVWASISVLLMSVSMMAAQMEDVELPMSLDDEASCVADGTCGGLELRQLRGEPLLAALQDEGTAGTCAAWLKLPGAECDDESEVAVTNPESVACGDDCSADTCCSDRASCDFFTASGGCAELALPADVTDMVWTPKEVELGEDMFCAKSERDADSCGKSCCELKPCTKCTGETYLQGCKAGNAGACSACPTESSCASGQHQACGEGVLGACEACNNAPVNAHYTGNSITSVCPWECDEGFENINGECISKACEKWNGTCDANTTEPRELNTPCNGKCTEEVCCAPRCLLHSCSKGLAPISIFASKVADTDQACCQSVGCEELSVRTAVVWPAGCETAKDEVECNSRYAVSGNVHKSGTGHTLYTACTWNVAKATCNWGSSKYQDCVL